MFGSLQRSSMGPAVGAPVGKRGRGGNVSAELLERKTVDKVSKRRNIVRVTFGSRGVNCVFMNRF